VAAIGLETAEVALAAVEAVEVVSVGAAAASGAAAGSFLAPETLGLSILIGAGIGAIGGIIGGVFAEKANREKVEAQEKAAEIARQAFFDAEEIKGAARWVETKKRFEAEAAVKNEKTFAGAHKFAQTTFKTEPTLPTAFVEPKKPTGVQTTAG
jgi:hypothetical protein